MHFSNDLSIVTNDLLFVINDLLFAAINKSFEKRKNV